MGALEDRIDADLQLGRDRELVPELEQLVEEHPLRERPRSLLMLALYRSGRQSEALDVYADGRRTLVAELGLEPSPELQELQRRILSHDATLAGPGQRTRLRGRRRGGLLLVTGGVILLAAGIAAGLLELTGTNGATGLSRVAANSVGVIDPKSGRIVAQVPAGLSPSDVAVGAGSVWVTSVDDQTVTRFDFNGGGIREKIRVGSGPGGIAADKHGVWVANSLEGTVSRIDPRANRVVQTIPAGSAPVSVALGDRAVWVASEGNQMLSRLDARSGDVTARIPVGVRPRAVAVGADSVWVADETRGVVFRIDPIRRMVVDTINVGNGPADIAVGADAVWVANNLDGTVSRIDPERGTVAATIPVGDGPRGLAIVGDSVWVSNEFGGTLAQIDPRTNTVRHVIRIGERPEGMTAAGGRLFVAVRSAGGAHRGGTLRLVAGHGPFKSGSVDTLNLSIAPTTILTNDGLVGFRRVGGADGRPTRARPRPHAANADGRRSHLHLPPPRRHPLLERPDCPTRGLPTCDRALHRPQSRLLPGDRRRERVHTQTGPMRPLAGHRHRRSLGHGDVPPERARSQLPLRARPTGRLRRASEHTAEGRRPPPAPGHRPVHDRQLQARRRLHVRPQSLLPRMVERRAARRLPRPHRGEGVPRRSR